MPPTDYRGLLDRAQAAIDALQAKVRDLEGQRTEPIAIIGMGCRFPGGAVDPESYWELLRSGRDAVVEVPPDRWDARALYDPDPDAPGKVSTRWGGFMDGVDRFDAAFFGISPREAASMDPQQRLLLEVTWEALERAGLPADRLRGSRGGVFLGIGIDDYSRFELRGPDLAAISAYSATGTLFCVAAGRLSYVLGLQGPCLAVDTGCSSSLVSVHLAAQSLRNRECEVALAGGVHLMLAPDVTVFLSRVHGQAADGRCKTFDAAADGYVRGEGCGMVVLKRLSDALAAGDPILAVLRGSAVNHDGASSGLTVPNRVAQEEVIRAALRAGGVPPALVEYVEAHGTGTALGDPIEVNALSAVYSEGRARTDRLVIGSVKTNLGHLEAAAGIAGLIKVVLAMRHGLIPAHLHFRTLNPKIDLEAIPATIPARQMPWPARGRPRLGAVSSFGIGGTNSHVVLEEAPPEEAAAPEEAGRVHLLPLSARSAGALDALIERYAGFLEGPGAGLSARDLAYTAGARRAHHPHRAAVSGSSPAELAGALRALRAERAGRGPDELPGAEGGRPGRVAFVFPGQGSQWPGMGRQLQDSEPAFRAALERCDAAIRAAAGWSVIAELEADAARSRLGQVDVIQPAIFAVQVALAELWRSWGLQPDAVVGHSMGEVAAAAVAGALSLEDAALVICERSRLVSRAGGRGAMAVVELAAAEAGAVLRGLEDRVSIAAANGPTTTLISGEPEAVDAALARLSADVFFRRIKVDYASHSPQMDPLREALVAALAPLRPGPARVPIHSTVTGEPLPGERLDAAYWFQNLRAPVQFFPAVRALLGEGFGALVEISPHPVLLPSMEAAIRHAGRPARAVASVRRDQPERRALLSSLAELYAAGLPVDFQRLTPAGKVVAPPAYPWQRERHWVQAVAPAGRARGREEPEAADGLAGRRVASPGREVQFVATVGVPQQPYLDDHRVFGSVVVPGAMHLATLFSAAQALRWDGCVVEDVVFTQVLAPEEPVQRHLVLSPQDGGGMAFEVSTPAGGEGQWRRHAQGRVHPGAAVPEGEARASLDELRARCPEELPAGEVQRRLWELGIELGPTFCWAERLWRGSGEALALLKPPPGVHPESAPLHPAQVDSCFQVLAATVPRPAERVPYVPFSVERASFHRRAEGPLWCHAVLRGPEAPEPETWRGDLRVLDETGALVADFRGLQLKRAPREKLLPAARGRGVEWLRETAWTRRDAGAARERAPGRWLIVAAGDGATGPLEEALASRGQPCLVARPGERFHPERPEDLDALLREASGGPAPLRGVVLAAAPDPLAPSPASPGAAAASACGAALHLVQALARLSLRDPPRLWILTRGAQPVGAARGPVAPHQAPLWGFARTLAYEHPELRATCVDLAPSPGAGDAAAVAGELLAGAEDEEIALRPEGRFVAAVADRPAGELATRLAWTPRVDATYLITGGLGGLGLAAARWLVDGGARHLVLVGRGGGEGAAQAAAVEALRAAGAEVQVARADVADRGQLARVLAGLGTGAPLRGVLHAAGVLDDGLVEQQDLERLRRVLSPKVDGAWNLHELTRDLPLDFFVLYSAAAALLGSPGQSTYAAANAFLDALAQHRRSLGLPALSIGWGPFSGVGLAAASDGRGARLSHRGLRSLTPEEGCTLLGTLVGSEVAHAAVLPLDARQWFEFYPQVAASPRLAPLARAAARAPSGRVRDGALRAALQASPLPGERLRLVERFVQEEAARVLRLDAARIGRGTALLGLGIDSLMGLELRNRLETGLGVRLPATVVWTYPVVSALAEHLLERWSAAAAPPAAPPPAPGSVAPVPAAGGDEAQLQNLTELEKSALLEKSLADLEEHLG